MHRSMYIPGERLVAEFKLVKQVRQHLRDARILYAAVDDVRRRAYSLHDALTRLVDVREPPRLSRQLACHVAARREHGLHVHPEALNDQPVLDDFQRAGQILCPFVQPALERRTVSVHNSSVRQLQQQQ